MIDVVIGSSYGDEGKGRVVNDLSSKETLVCRFNGGDQAGHTVVHDGVRHVFSHFGAGTLKGAITYLSEFFVCHPLKFLMERDELKSKGILPRVIVDPRSLVTTP